jgi:ribosomal protein S18 acetylase RimI-like enzyme
MTDIASLVTIRLACQHDISSCKQFADAHRAALGFLTRALFAEAITRNRLLVAETSDGVIAGFLRFNHRLRGTETALYDICVDRSLQRRGIGRALVSSLVSMCQEADRSAIVLRCPEELPANSFYKRLGFQECDIEPGRRRRLIVWRLTFEERPWSS